MRPLLRTLAVPLVLACCLAAPVHATDVDGPNDCTKIPMDFGDAPEGVQAYLGVLACFPTCTAAGPVGTYNVVCPPISTVPGAAGFVRHLNNADSPPYWLGCTAVQSGIDTEANGKMNDTGGPVSACGTGVAIDCVEAAFGLNFGQDECYGTDDAGIAAAINFPACGTGSVTFTTTNCLPAPRQVYLNILVDWNQDGDWNDNFQCVGGCSYEWAVKNVLIILPPGCGTLTSPSFITGPNAGNGWLRITLSDTPANDDFPWAGCATVAGQAMRGGETEDYPVTIGHPQDPCPEYEDWGDAPEEVLAYPGIMGHFPTCAYGGVPGNQTIACPPLSTPPGITGYVRHLSVAGAAQKFWMGCGDPAAGTTGIDSEPNGKMNDTGAPLSICDQVTAIDCVESPWAMNFGQDECYGDPPGDAGLASPVSFTTCTASSITFKTYNCKTQTDAFLNILVDWNGDGDWNDNFDCPGAPGVCAYEWAVKNVAIPLPPGCTTINSPMFLSGPFGGRAWMRVTLTDVPVNDDFPWAGSATYTAGQGAYAAGETEDYPVDITGTDPCQVGYTDFGDAPEDIPAYPQGIPGRFPTCLAPSAPGTQELECGVIQSTPPGPTGYVQHTATATDLQHFWLGCGTAASPGSGVDGELDGKVNIGGPAGTPSACASFVNVDCAEAVFMTFGQDECYGTPDAALGSPVSLMACSTAVVKFEAYNCGTEPVTVMLNLLVDWNGDADWNDNLSVLCSPLICAYEWAVKNVAVTLAPGCNTIVTPQFATGPKPGYSWMRITLSMENAPDDFPWNGSASMPGGTMTSGETEDYPIFIVPRTTGVEDRGGRSGLWLAPPSPNPARDALAIRYQLPRESDVSLAVYDLAGRKVAELADGRVGPGEHVANWNFRDASGRDLAAGHYVIKLRVGDVVLTRRAIRVK